MGANDHERVPEESVEPILARAAELDRRERESVSVDVLRSAALEAGISANAVDRAVQEYAASVKPAEPVPAPGPLGTRLGRPLTPQSAVVALAGAAAVFSAAAVTVHAHTPGVAFAAIAAGAVGALVIRWSGRRGSSKPSDDAPPR